MGRQAPQVPGLLPLEDRMNARYQRFGQRWQPNCEFNSPLTNDIRISWRERWRPRSWESE